MPKKQFRAATHHNDYYSYNNMVKSMALKEDEKILFTLFNEN